MITQMATQLTEERAEQQSDQVANGCPMDEDDSNAQSSQWQSSQLVMDEFAAKFKQINDTNKKRYEQIQEENRELRLELEAMKASKVQQCCHHCGKVVNKMVHCDDKCLEATIRNRMQPTVGLED